jgi:EmrB/QacA subfamily drug resistance transporter
MVILDATIVNVALPSIQADLQMSESGLQWVVNAYALLFGGFLLLGGRAGDLIGRKRIFLAGLVLFTAASLLCALSTGETMLILARGLQGLGAALVSPAALSIVTTTFKEGAERTKALGVWAAIAVGGGAVGLVLGGLLVETLSWPWIFFVNVPVGIAAFIVSLRYVPESKDEHVHKSFDVAGAVAVTGGLIALVYGIVRSAESGWGSAEVLGFLALAAVLLVAFVLIERRSAEPLVRLSIFSVRTVRGANAAMFVVAAGLFAMFFFNTLYVQRVLGFSPLEAGFAFVPFTAGVIIGAGLSQKLVPALGAREVPLIGAAIGALGLLLFLRRRPASRDHADLDRHGPRVRADHADRDERRSRRRRWARVRSLQHRAADRRRARARSPDDARNEPDRGRARVLRVAAVRGAAGGGARQRIPRHVARERDPPRRRRPAALPARPPP